MLKRELKEIRRKLAEVKAGIEVRDDPWEIVETLLNEAERLRARCDNPDPAFWEPM